MENVFLIDDTLESSLINTVCLEVKEKFKDLSDVSKLGVLCVSPDYSGTVSMRVLHALHNPDKNPLPEYVCIDTPYDTDSDEQKNNFKVILNVLAPYFKQKVDKVVVVSAIDSEEYSWVKEVLIKANFLEENLTFVSLVESKDSNFKSEIVGEYIEFTPKFWWEAH
jgi:hypothetical protein